MSSAFAGIIFFNDSNVSIILKVSLSKLAFNPKTMLFFNTKISANDSKF